jgi:hypothetical protein
MNARKTETGMVMMGMIAEGTCQRNTRITRLTMIISSSNEWVSVWIARWINSERSYVVTISTPSGSDDLISSILAFTR